MSDHMKPYEPELGQAIFGQEAQAFECPDILDAVLAKIDQEAERVLGNLNLSRGDGPPSMNGQALRCQVFGIWAYDWGREGQPYNFKHVSSGLEVSWYKYPGRGMSCNMTVTPDLADTVLRDCMTALGAIERKEMFFMHRGEHDVPYFEPAKLPVDRDPDATASRPVS